MLALNSKPMGFILSFHVILYTVHFTKFFLKRSNKIHTQVIILKFSHSQSIFRNVFDDGHYLHQGIQTVS